MKRKSAPWVRIAILLAPAIAVAGDREDLKAAHERYEAAFQTRHLETLAGSLHPNYSETSIDSDVPAGWTNKSAAERQRCFQDLLAPYEAWGVRLIDLQYRVAGSTGVVEGTEWLTRKPLHGVLEYPRWRFTAVWVKEEGRWLMLTCHRSAMPAVAPGAPPLGDSPAETRLLDAALSGPRFANVPMVDARLLRVLAEASGARTIVELGTSTGFSAIWLCNALRKSGGTLTTFELDPKRAAIAREQFRRAGVESMVTLIEGNAHENIAKLRGPIDLVFIDAEKEGYPDYLERLLPLVRPGGLILAHNMRWPTPSAAYVHAVTTNPKLETVFVNMDDQGLGVTLKKR